MSQLIISRFFKPFLCKTFLRQTSIGHIRFLSSTTHTSTGLYSDSDHEPTIWKTSSTTAHPFLLVDHVLKTAYNGEIKDMLLMWTVYDAMAAGFTHNGVKNIVLTYKYGEDESKIRPSISYHPTNRKLKAMEVKLPMLPTGSQIQYTAMSCLPNQDKDWVIGVKLTDSRVIFCRPFGSCQWVEVKTKPECIHPFSSIMFSKKDQRFYVPTPGGNYLCSFDPYSKKEEYEAGFIDLEFDDLLESVFDDLADVSSCSKTDHLAESPTGQLFLVRRYGKDEEHKQDNDNKNGMKTLLHKTKQFMVFKAEEPIDKYCKTMIYTEDIGDLCIFVGHMRQAFCVPASSSPGLKPNCIYFMMDHNDFGVYNLTTKTCTLFHN